MTDRELMQQVWEAMANVDADFVCEASHHVKKDQHGWHEPCPIQQRWHIAFEALSERLSQPEHEPVAWAYPEALEAFKKGKPWVAYGSSGERRIPLFLSDAVAPKAEPRSVESGAGFESLPASPTWWDDPVPQMRREWKGLTADEIWQCNAAPPESAVEYHVCMAHQNVLDFAEAIEAKLRERNT